IRRPHTCIKTWTSPRMPRVVCRNRSEPAKDSTPKRPNALVAPTVNVVVAVAVNTVDASLVDAVAAGVPRTVSASVHASVNGSTVPAVTTSGPRPANVVSVPVHVDIMVKLYGAILLGSRTTHRGHRYFLVRIRPSMPITSSCWPRSQMSPLLCSTLIRPSTPDEPKHAHRSKRCVLPLVKVIVSVLVGIPMKRCAEHWHPMMMRLLIIGIS